MDLGAAVAGEFAGLFMVSLAVVNDCDRSFIYGTPRSYGFGSEKAGGVTI